MFSDTLNLRTEQLLRNRLWRHSIVVDQEESTPDQVAKLLVALIDGLREREEGLLEAYVVLSEKTVDRSYFDSILLSESPRRPLVGDFGAERNEGWRNDPLVFQLTDPALIFRFVERYWGNGGLSIFFSMLDPIPFFKTLRRFRLVRHEGGSLVWAPYWAPESFEKFLTESGPGETDRVFRQIGYYMMEGEKGNAIRIYCRGDE